MADKQFVQIDFNEDPYPIEEMTLELAMFFAALGDTKRMEIIAGIWHGEATAGDLALDLELSPSRLAHHLRKLEAAGVIWIERRGRNKVISLPDHTREAVESATGAVTIKLF